MSWIINWKGWKKKTADYYSTVNNFHGSEHVIWEINYKINELSQVCCVQANVRIKFLISILFFLQALNILYIFFLWTKELVAACTYLP